MQPRHSQRARSNYLIPSEATITEFVSRNKRSDYDQLLQTTTSANKYINLLQYTLIIIEKNRTLSNEARARFSAWVFTLLHRKLHSLTRNERSQLQSRHLATALHRLGKILSSSPAENFNIHADQLNLVLNYLCQLPNLDTQGVANALYGVGQLAAADKFSDRIDVNHLNQLLGCLSQLPNLKTQEIANALYGIGQLATANKFSGMIDVTHLNQLLGCLSQLPNLNTQGIANALYGIGQLAAADKFNGKIDINYLDTLLAYLPQLHNLKTQEIANTLYGIGQLAAADKFSGRIGINHLNQLLEYLSQPPNLKTQEIANALYGIGQLATADKFNGRIDINHLNQLLAYLPQLPTLDTQGIANALYGIGQLAVADKFSGRIDINYLNQLLGCLSQLPNLETQHIANTLYGISQLAVADKLTQSPDQNLILHLAALQQFCHLNPIETSQVAQAFAFLEIQIPQHLLSTLAAKKPAYMSSYQKTAINILENNLTNIEITPEHLIDAWFVDIYFEYQGKKYILELDGPHHYVNGILRGEDALRDNHFKKKGYHVIRIKNEDLSEQVLLDHINTSTQPANTGTGLLTSSSTLFSWSAFRNELRLNALAREADQSLNTPLANS